MATLPVRYELPGQHITVSQAAHLLDTSSRVKERDKARDSSQYAGSK